MDKREPKWLWRVKLVFWLLRYGYTHSAMTAWRWSRSSDWLDLYRDGYTAHDAVREDASYGDA